MPLTWKSEKVWRRKGFTCLVGVDEAGRGPWAGPVVAGAVVLPEDFPIRLLDDSKKLSERRRQEAYQELISHPGVSYSVAQASVEEIDQLNILRATFLAMERAVQALTIPVEVVLVDGRDFPFFMTTGEALIGGDGMVPSIAAASILAKETRDATMRKISSEYPHYGFDGHKGYGTRKHHQALQQYGPCPHHRRSFAPVRALLET